MLPRVTICQTATSKKRRTLCSAASQEKWINCTVPQEPRYNIFNSTTVSVCPQRIAEDISGIAPRCSMHNHRFQNRRDAIILQCILRIRLSKLH